MFGQKVKYRLGQSIKFYRDNGRLQIATIIDRNVDTAQYHVTYIVNNIQIGMQNTYPLTLEFQLWPIMMILYLAHSL
jgi:hypothetical protein